LLLSRSFKKIKLQRQRVEIDNAVKALHAMKKDPDKARVIQTMVSDNTVIVKVQSTETTRPRVAVKSFETRLKMTRAGNIHRTRDSGKFVKQVDQSVADTQRAVRTLKSEPSQKVEEIYERLAAGRIIRN